MRFHSIFIIATAFVLPTLAAGQTTWRGLRFGMSLSEAKEALSKSGSEVKRGRGTEAFNVSPNFDLDVPGSVKPAHFLPVLGIGEKGLDTVTLTLDWAAYRNVTQSFSAGTVIPGTVIQDLSELIFEQLAIKYGRPLSESGTCTAVSVTSFLLGHKAPSCRAVWKGDKQTVTLYWTFTHFPNEEDSNFLIEYKPEIDGL